MNKKVVIIGAGGTGRGFIPRLLQEDGVSFCFLDKDEKLIKALTEEKSFVIDFGEVAPPVTVSGYEAYVIDSEEAVAKAAEADYIFVSIGEKQLPTITGFLKKAAEKKQAELKVVVFENGIAPKLVLRKALQDAGVENVSVTQGVIFCSSLPAAGKKLDIVSEKFDVIPYDVDDGLFKLPFEHFPATKEFGKLLQRKIYTYNCLSACIAYTGYYLGYTVYADAANDPLIVKLCDKVCVSINSMMCKYMGVSEEEQYAFSQRALKKFRNHQISDTIKKNARSAAKKLGPTERIVGPMELMEKYCEDTSTLKLVAALALYYLEEAETLELDNVSYSSPEELFRAENPQIDKECLTEIENILKQIRQKEPLEKIAEL